MPDPILRLLDEIDFLNPARARADLIRLGATLPQGILNRVELLLASVPDPDQALRYLETLYGESPHVFSRLATSAAALTYLITTFSYSRFLADALMRRPEYLLQLTEEGLMHRVLRREEYVERLLEFLPSDCTGVPEALLLARFRRRQILRILLRDVLGHATLSDLTEELSYLSDAIVEVALARIRQELVERHGEPSCGFSVIALGKLGGKELNYSSDIDLMFLYGETGDTAGEDSISNKEFFKKAANRLTELLSTYTAEGLCYRVDLRLRPDGRYGEVVISLDGARTYYQNRARAWELQMLIKARVCAGDSDPGRGLLAFVQPMIYASSLDFRTVEALSETRERLNEKLAAKRSPPSAIDIKLARGGIRDIEFLVQCLQRLHGGQLSWVREAGTLFALFRLRDKNLLSGNEYARLASAYQFLRHLEHRLQFDEDRQIHTLPSGTDALTVLARKMPSGYTTELTTAQMLLTKLNAHLEDVQELYERVIYAQRPMYYAPSEAGGDILPEAEAPSSNLTRFLDTRAPQLAGAVSQSRLNRGRDRFEHFLEKLFSNPEMLDRLEGNQELSAALIDIFEFSRYFSEQLLRYPELIDEIGQPVLPESPAFNDAAELRRFFRQQMFRIQSDSILNRRDIFDTLEQTSDLADRVVMTSYAMALRQVVPPAGYTVADQMMVIALGRLGMREFDLASDADLVFVIPDEDAPHQVYWTAVAERIINTISAYTGDGVLFTVDTRLRPNGREGALVQSVTAYMDYFARFAEAWEGISYMKARAVAGNLERATEFLNDLQVVDWRRYGQSGRSRAELGQMRARLEREQGVKNPLKAGMGGYYDIDFALMYLRLRGAGIFFKVLNTPARILVIEKTGHLNLEDADFLRDASAFYRAIDHGLRVATGHAEGNVPKNPAQFEVLTELVRRWTPAHLHDQPLDAQLARIRQGTREFFNRVFGA